MVKPFIHNQIPNTSIFQMVMFDFNIQSESLELPIIWIFTNCLMYLWDSRCNKNNVCYDNFRAELLSKFDLFRRTTFKNEITILAAMLSDLFHEQLDS